MSTTTQVSARGRIVRIGLTLAILAVIGATWRALGGADSAPVPMPLAKGTDPSEATHETSPIQLTKPREAASRTNGNRATEGAVAEVPARHDPRTASAVARVAAAVHGMVRDREGFAVVGAEVVALRQLTSDEGVEVTWQRLEESMRTLTDGSFRFVDAPQGVLRFRAVLDDGRRSDLSETVTVEPRGVYAGVELVVPIYDDPTAVSGVVLDVDGSPLPFARLQANRHRAATNSGLTCVADQRGRFRFSGASDATFRIVASHPNGEATPAFLEDVAAGRHDLVLRLSSPTHTTLRVRDTGGIPVTRFAYRLRIDDPLFTRFATERPLNKLGERIEGAVSIAQPGEPFFVQVTAPGHADLEVGPFEPSPALAHIDAQMTPLPALRGRVVRGGAPVVGALVRAQEALDPMVVRRERFFHLAANPFVDGPSTRTGEDGSFTLDVGKRGAWWLRASVGPAAAAWIGPVTSGRASGSDVIEIDLAPRGSIVGRVRAANGEALGGRRVDASCGDGEVRTTMTDAAGEYRLVDLAPGPWQVRCIEWAEASSTPTEHTHILAGAPPIPWDCEVVEGASTRFDIVVPEKDP